MDNNFDNLKRLIDNLKSIGFFGRLFRWQKIKNQLIDAVADMQKLMMNNENVRERNATLEQDNANKTKDLEIFNREIIKKEAELDKLNLSIQDSATKISGLTSDLSSANTTISDLTKRKVELEIEKLDIKKDFERVQADFLKVTELNTQLLSNEEIRKQEHSQQTATLKGIQDSIQSARDKEIKEKHEAEIERLENLKLTWTNHQENVKQVVKSICNKHTIEYVDKVPFKGEPDNTLRISGEFVVFDAKSPRNEDLTNFPGYIKEQSEKARKYANEENVKKWIFFVVPANTLGVLKNFVYSLADYDVFVITLDSLEPVILSLKKIEDYDFADQLNPEDRENICRVLGKFAHLSKRRIQIDTYFINQFMEIAYKCESDLPADILEKVIEFEKAEKLNPPQEKRAKAINIIELEKATQQLRNDAMTKGILIEDEKISTGLNELPLYKPETE